MQRKKNPEKNKIKTRQQIKKVRSKRCYKVFALSIDISDLYPLSRYICLNITRNFFLYLIRRWVVVYLAFSLWTVCRWFVVYLVVFLWTVSRWVVVYLTVSLWMVSSCFQFFSYAELEFLWWQFTMVFETIFTSVWDFVCYTFRKENFLPLYGQKVNCCLPYGIPLNGQSCFPIFSLCWLELLWWKFTIVVENIIPIVFEFFCYLCGCCCKSSSERMCNCR